MAYSFITYSKQGDYFHLVFENDLEPEHYLKVKLLPYNSSDIFSKQSIDLLSIRMRDPESILHYIEQYGLTLITEGLK